MDNLDITKLDEIVIIIKKITFVWTLISKNLPPKSGRYLAYNWYLKNIEIQYWDGEKWDCSHEISAWADLPQIPDDDTTIILNEGNALEFIHA